jgi:hypothetical protein
VTFRTEQARPLQIRRSYADAVFVTATHIPRISAAALAAAATRLLGTVVLDVADMTTAPARYLPRLEAFAAIDSDEELGADDATLIVLVQPGAARDLIDEYGTAGRAAAALNRQLRTEWTA